MAVQTQQQALVSCWQGLAGITRQHGELRVCSIAEACHIQAQPSLQVLIAERGLCGDVRYGRLRASQVLKAQAIHSRA